MASAQQKAKKEKGSRQAGRPNGKAWKKSVERHGPKNDHVKVVDERPKDYSKHTETQEEKTRLVLAGKDGNRVSGRGKPSGHSYRGFGRGRAGITVWAQFTQNELDERYAARKLYRATTPKAARNKTHYELNLIHQKRRVR